MIDGAAISHVIAWVIGGMSVTFVVLVSGAMFALGRSSYRK
ncbi:hypothetical protein QMO46_11425 [Microbacterium barkeri]|nr:MULTISPECIES: hypothetical protein [Microbacterium]MDI6944104.1 hypothetical protein [Microbacterium barkeri]